MHLCTLKLDRREGGCRIFNLCLFKEFLFARAIWLNCIWATLKIRRFWGAFDAAWNWVEQTLHNWNRRNFFFFFILGIIFQNWIEHTLSEQTQTSYFTFHQTVCYAWMYAEDKLQRICEDFRHFFKTKFLFSCLRHFTLVMQMRACFMSITTSGAPNWFLVLSLSF